MEDTGRAPPENERRESRLAATLLALLSLTYLAFLAFFVPRLNNFVYSDREFTGWVMPIAARLNAGARLYSDAVLPIPPGSFEVLALVQRVTGKVLLLHELWFAALSHWLMGLMAYAVAARFSTRKVALLVATVTLVLVTQAPKECIYDHTSLLCAWLAVVTGMNAVLGEGTASRRAWLATGVLTGASLAFKQSTATGMVAGWALALAYLWAVETRHGRRDRARAHGRAGAVFALGFGLGLLVVLASIFGAHATVGGFVQAVLVDGPPLKGGVRTLVKNLFLFVFHYDAIRNTIVPTAVVIAIGLGVARRAGGVHVGDEPGRRAAFGAFDVTLLVAAPVVTYGVATAMLAGEVRALDLSFSAVCEGLKNVPAYGFVYAAVFFAAHLRESTAATPEARDRGHALNAVILATMTTSLVYDTSFVEFNPFYFNEPSIPVVLLCLFVATERSGFSWATPLVLSAAMLATFGTKLNRALSDDTPVDGTAWAGLRVNYRGVEVLRAAARARELAGPAGTVLVLPEDEEFVGLIDRPRPPLTGAIVFVDQYPARLLAGDIAALDAHLPDVIVLHPRRERDWRAVFHTWTIGSAAEHMMEHVLKVLPRRYALDSSYPSIFFWDQGEIDVFVRKPGGAP
ncbi:MAG TPA: hypothetical protein VH062_23880 [Polyangiaceae bacterium]|jgi:hypothetical protein|nr:hypothetical protein [Polyangiaceae bacterium]